MNSPTARHLVIAGILAGLLAGCAGTPTVPVSEAERNLNAAIANLDTQPAAERDTQTVQLMQQLNVLSQYDRTLELGQRYTVAPDNIEQFPGFASALARAHFAVGDARSAEQTLTDALTHPAAFIGLNDEILLIEQRIQALEALRQDMRAFEDRVYLSVLTPADQNGAVLGALWQQARQLVGQVASDPNSDAAGWIQLAEILSAENPNRAALEWFRIWPDHPANAQLPLEVADLLNLDWPSPTRVGLILPLSGALSAVGESVLDGVMEQKLNDVGPTLVVADGAQGVEQALETLRAQQVDLILGPLPKAQVKTLLELNPTEPVLALNYSDLDLQDARAPRALMGLSPEDSARDAAQLLAATSEKRPLVLVPGDELGQRVADAFNAFWPEPEKRAPIIQRYLNDDQRQVISGILGIEASQARHKQLSRALGLDIEFTPRRRQDVGAVYIYADSITAAQLKPLLAFYYAGNLPVWLADTALDQNIDLVRTDLVGANVVAMPWQADQITESNVLFELGADAWLLASALADPNQATVPGRTGEWFRDGNALRRTLTPVKVTQDGFDILERPAPETYPEAPMDEAGTEG